MNESWVLTNTMEDKIGVGSVVRLKTGGKPMVVSKISEDGLVAYCSWVGVGEIKYVNVAFLTSILIIENPGDN